MSLTLDDVAWIANLARLALTKEEMEAYRVQLSAVLEYAARLDELDLTGVEPSAHAILRHNIWREDIIEPSLPLEDVLFNAAATAHEQFLIQSVLDE